MIRMAGLLTVLVFVAAACSDDQPAAGPVTIETQIPMTEEGAPIGTFEVTEGAEVLGCVSGSFADEVSQVGDLVEVTKVMTCESGEREGTFNVAFTPEPGPGITQISTWTVAQPTGGFTGLQGAGDMVMEPTETGATETFTGDIEYGS